MGPRQRFQSATREADAGALADAHALDDVIARQARFRRMRWRDRRDRRDRPGALPRAREEAMLEHAAALKMSIQPKPPRRRLLAQILRAVHGARGAPADADTHKEATSRGAAPRRCRRTSRRRRAQRLPLASPAELPRSRRRRTSADDVLLDSAVTH